MNNQKKPEHSGELLVRRLAESMTGCDLNSLEGRTWFVFNSKEIVVGLKAGKQRSDLVRLVAELSSLKETDLLHLWGLETTAT